mgnify:CR=1 FL=1
MGSKKKTSVAVDVEKNAPLKTKEYEKELRRLHVELVKLQQWVVAKGLKVCIVFEGRDGGEDKRVECDRNKRAGEH